MGEDEFTSEESKPASEEGVVLVGLGEEEGGGEDGFALEEEGILVVGLVWFVGLGIYDFKLIGKAKASENSVNKGVGVRILIVGNGEVKEVVVVWVSEPAEGGGGICGSPTNSFLRAD